MEKSRNHVLRPFVNRVSLLKQELRLVAPAGLDTQKMDANPEFLRLLDPDSDILIAGHQDGVSHRPIPGEHDHVCHEQRIHPLLFPDCIHEAKPELQTRFEGECQMLGRWTRRSSIVPINPQQRQTGNPRR